MAAAGELRERLTWTSCTQPVASQSVVIRLRSTSSTFPLHLLVNQVTLALLAVLARPAFAADLDRLEVLDLPAFWDIAGGEYCLYGAVVDEGHLVVFDRNIGDGDQTMVYRWDGAGLQGPYGLIGGGRLYGATYAAMDGGRLAIARYSLVDLYTWSESDQAYLYDETVEGWAGVQTALHVAIQGDHLAVRIGDAGLRMYHEGSAGWEMTFADDHLVYPLGGPQSLYLQDDTLRYVRAIPQGGQGFDDLTLDVVRTFDRSTRTWEVTSEVPLEGLVDVWVRGGASYAPSGRHLISTGELPFQVFDVSEDADGELVVRSVDAFEGKEGETGLTFDATEQWVAAYDNRISFTLVSVVHMGSPVPFMWGQVLGAGSSPVLQTIGFLDPNHFVTIDDYNYTSPNDIGQVIVWEMSGPPIQQWLADPTPDEGASVALDAFIYLVDPNHDRSDVTITLLAAPTLGTLTLDGTPLPQAATVDAQAWMDGRVRYAHDGSETTADTFTTQACDPEGACSDELLVDVVITPVNDAPIPADDLLTVPEDGEGVVDVLANDLDPDSTLDLLGVSVGPALPGSAAVQTDGVRYVHDGSEPGTDPVEVPVTVCDPQGGCATSTLYVTITPVNDPPVAADDLATVDEGGTVTVDLLANDHDPDDDLEPIGYVTVLSGPVNGTATLTASGLEVQHDGAEAVSDSVRYEVCDAAGLCDQATVALAVMPVNDAPLLQDDALVLAEGGSAVLAPLGNDVDVDGSLDAGTLAVVVGPAHGTVSVGGDAVTYVHDGSEGADDAFTYTVCDDGGACSEATVQVVVLPVDDPPVVADDVLTVAEGGEGSVDLLANDSDPDGGYPVVQASAGAHGAVSVAAGVLTYRHGGGESVSDAVAYQVCGATGCQAGSLAVTITPVDDAPVAVPDAYGTDGELVVAASDGVLANDSDVDSTLVAERVRGPEHGSLAQETDGGIVYTPEEGFSGTDRFTYAAADGTSRAEAVVELAVGGTQSLVADVGETSGGGCGCSSSRASAGWLALVALGVVQRRR